MITRRFTVPFLVLVLGLRSTVSPCALDFPDTLGKIVDKGDRYLVRLLEPAKGGVKTAEAVFFVRADLARCRNVITDYRHYPEFMPNIKAAKPVKAPGGSVHYAFVLGAGLWDIDYTIRLREVSSDSAWELVWDYVEGDIGSTTGSWNVIECKEMPGWVKIRYRVCVDAGKFVPAWVSTLLTTKSIPGLIKSVRERTGTKK